MKSRIVVTAVCMAVLAFAGKKPPAVELPAEKVYAASVEAVFSAMVQSVSAYTVILAVPDGCLVQFATEELSKDPSWRYAVMCSAVPGGGVRVEIKVNGGEVPKSGFIKRFYSEPIRTITGFWQSMDSRLQ